MCLPATKEVVEHSSGPGDSDGVVSPDISHERELRAKWHVGAQESDENGCEGAFLEPEFEGVHHELRAAVGVLLPSHQFVVDSE